MISGLAFVTLYVKDQEEAVTWYTEKLGFEKRMDAPMGPDYRWVTIGVPGQPDVSITLHKPMSENQKAQLGNQAMGVLSTTDCRGDVERLRGLGVAITHEPEEMPFGTMAFIEDLNGSMFVLVQPPG